MYKYLSIFITLIFGLNTFAQCDDILPKFTVSQSEFCGAGPHVINLTNISSGANSSLASYDWYLDGVLLEFTSGLVSPSPISINTIGTHTIELIATDDTPCTAAFSLEIKVFPTAIPSFTFSPDNECANTTINFSNTSLNTHAETIYSWNFGDGSSASTANPSHSYSAGGNYTVTLTVQNGVNCPGQTFSLPVQVQDVPVLNGIIGDGGDGTTTNCLMPADPTTTYFVQFYGNTANGVSYHWNFGDGSTSTDENPSHLYTSYGTFNVTLTVTGANDCTITDNIVVVFERFVSASLALDLTEYSGCTPLNLSSLTNNSNNANNYSWNFGDGSPTIVSSNPTPPDYSYTTPGNFTITLNASNSCNTAFATIGPIIVVGKPNVNFSLNGNNGCAPASIGFTNSTTGTSPANAYTWDMGNGNAYNNTITPTQQGYDESGSYTVSLTASNACGDSTFTRTFFLDTIPVAAIDLDPNEGCSPMTVNITNNSSGNITNNYWYYNGSYYSGSQNVGPFTYNYPPGNSPVTHTVGLTVGNHCGSSSVAENIIVHRPTLANFSSVSTVCFGTDVTFTNQSLGEELTFEWDFGNGTTSTDAGPHTIDYDTPGTYTVELIAKGYCGNDTITRTVTVHPPTIAEIEPLGSLEDCSPMEVFFQNNSSGANLSYQWNIDGVNQGNGTDLGPITFTEAPGNNPVTHTVQLVVNSSCGTQTTNAIIVVHRPTEANLTIDPSEVCIGTPINFSQNSLGEDLTFEWDFGNGTTSTESGPHQINYDEAGEYDVTFIAKGYCGNDTIHSVVTVNPFPIADFEPNILSGCEVLELDFTNNSTNTANHSWNFGNGAIPSTSSSFDPGSVEFHETGTIEIVLVVEENGCISSDTSYVEVFPLPEIDFTILPQEGCTDLEVEITNQSVDNGVEIFSWDFGNGQTFTGYQPGLETYTANENDSIYEITLTVQSGLGCLDSLTQQVIVHPNPIADFDFTNDEICQNSSASFINNSTIGMDYLWDFGDGNTSTQFEPTHQYDSDGTFAVSLIVRSPHTCSDTIEKQITILPIAEAEFSATTVCFGYESEFTDLSIGNIVSWSWDFGDGNTSEQQNPTHTYSSTGSFTTQLTIENEFECITSFTDFVLVNEVPIADFESTDFCADDLTQFTQQITGNYTGVEWYFNDGSPLNTSENPQHNFSSAGAYNVQLIVFGGSGCSDTITKEIIIDPVPEVDFNAISACTNDTTFFTFVSNDQPENYSWNFGNGQVDNSNIQNTSVLYNTAGDYEVTLTATYAATGCNNTVSKIVEAYPRTSPQFSATTECLLEITEFTDETAGNPNMWNWSFGDGTTANTQNTSHDYSLAGTYEVSLITENVFGCSDTISEFITVHPLPIAEFEFDNVCLNAVTTITDLSTDAVSWEYDFGDGNGAFEANPTHLFATDGNQTVQQVVTNQFGCKDTISHSVIVFSNPTADFIADTACFSFPTTFNNNSIDATFSSWNFDDLTSTSTIPNPEYTYSQDGSFNVELIVENDNGCLDTVVKSVLVLPQPVADFINTTVCARDVVNFTDQSSSNPINFEWNFGDGSGTFNGSEVTHIFTSGGFYDISLNVQNAAGCTDTIERTIEVYTVPNVDFTADTVCLFTISHFTDLSVDSTPLSNWTWSFGDGNTSGVQNPTYIYQNSGIYDVVLTVSNIHGCDSTIQKQVQVSHVPVADFEYTSDCFGAPTIFEDLSTNNPEIYNWNFGDGTITNDTQSQEHTYTSPGIYVVELQVFDADSICGSSTTQIVEIVNGAEAGMFIPEEVCVNELFDFFSNSTSGENITTYSWNFGDGTTYNTGTGKHLYTEPGVYTVSIDITTESGCQDHYEQTILVHPSPEVNFTWENTCMNSLTQFTNTTIGNTTSWHWDFGNGETAETQFPSTTYTSAGTYTVTLIAQNLTGCSNTIEKQVLIDPVPIIDFTADLVCYGETTSFTNLSTITPGSITSYNWNFGNEGNSTALNPEYLFENYQQEHEVTLVATSNKGCVDSITKTVTLLPIVDFSFDLDDLFGCAPQTIVFGNESSIQNASIQNYLWDFGDGYVSFQESPTHIFQEEGVYPVSLTVTTTDGCEIEYTSGLELTIFPSPTAAFDVNPPITSINNSLVKITDESYGATQWEYDLGDGNYSNQTHLTHVYNHVNIYYITQWVENEYGCIDSTQRAVEIQDDFILYVPNSFTPDDMNSHNDYFTWAVSGFKHFEMRIFNRWGELIYETDDAEGYWNGKYNDFIVKDGVYIWQAKIIDLNDIDHMRTGHVTVIK